MIQLQTEYDYKTLIKIKIAKMIYQMQNEICEGEHEM